MADGPGPQLFWRVLDALDFWLTQARLWVADAVCGPDPDTPADRARHQFKAFCSGTGESIKWSNPEQT